MFGFDWVEAKTSYGRQLGGPLRGLGLILIVYLNPKN